LLSSLPLGVLWVAVLAALLLAGLPLAIVRAGPPVLALAEPACVLGAGVERRRLGALLGARLPSPFRPLAREPALWRGLLYLVLLIPVGLVELVVVLLLAFSAVLVAYPLWLGTLPEGRGLTWTGDVIALRRLAR